ncbi:hypothetical protein GCM10020256_13730 [Streptomyces thermocoprophilus]
MDMFGGGAQDVTRDAVAADADDMVVLRHRVLAVPAGPSRYQISPSRTQGAASVPPTGLGQAPAACSVRSTVSWTVVPSPRETYEAVKPSSPITPTDCWARVWPGTSVT